MQKNTATYTDELDLGVELEDEPKVGGYRFLLVLGLLLAVGGLFLGLLSSVLKVFAHASVYQVNTGVLKGALDASLMGYIIAAFKGIGNITFSLGNLTQSIKSLLPLVFSIALIASVVVAIICFIVGCASRKAAKNSAMSGLIITTLVYLALFGWSLFMARNSASLKAMLGALDVPTAIIAGAALLTLAITALVRQKGYGLMNILLFIFTCAALFALVYPGSYTVAHLSTTINAMLKDIPSLLIFVIGVMLVVNLLAALIRMSAHKAYPFDCVRYGVTLLVVIAFVLLVVIKPYTGDVAATMFKGSALVPSVILIVAVLGAVLLSVLAAILSAPNKAKEEEEIEEEEEYEEVAEPAPTPAYNYAPVINVNYPAVAPAVEAAPAAPAPVAAQSAQPAPATREFSQFELDMMALAQGQAPAAAQSAQPAPTHSNYDAAQYTYDAFINSLSPAEKNEFGDIFIAKKNGLAADLPTYVIGGDNSDFFRQVWIRYYKYGMSAGLKDKMYRYLISLKG